MYISLKSALFTQINLSSKTEIDLYLEILTCDQMYNEPPEV